MPTTNGAILGLDVGSKRIGIAIASLIARLPHPVTTLSNDENFIARLQELITAEDVQVIVVGLPRGMSGQETAQTKTIESFVASMRTHIALPFYFQDEALTSQKAETELNARGKLYDKGAVDALAATYILEDYLASHEGVQ